MDEKIRTAGGKITGTIVIFCGMLMLPVAIFALSTKPEWIWWLGLILFFCSLAAIYGGIRALLVTKRKSQFSHRERKMIMEQIQPTEKSDSALPVSETKNIILAHWIYSFDEWKQFKTGERKERKTDLIIEIILVALFGGAMIHFLRNESWFVSFAFSMPVALVIGFLRYRFNPGSVSLAAKNAPEVIITDNAVLVNGHFNRFYGDNLWIGKVDVRDTGKMNILEIIYCWNTRSGRTSEEIRVPVPKGKIREAIEVQEKLMTAR